MRTLFVFMGHASLAFGFVGIFVPLLPTTPFVLLAAMCYARGSDRFHTWIHEHPRFGPMISEWREHRAISVRAKFAATFMVVLSITFAVIRLAPPWNIVSLIIGAGVLTFLLSRPSVGRRPASQGEPNENR